MGYSQKYCIVSFPEKLTLGTEFSMEDWPVHITLAGTFAIELTDSAVGALATLANDQLPVGVSAKSDAVLGETKVVVLKKSFALQNLHNQIIDILYEYGAKFNTPEYVQDGFLPHSTIQKSGRLHLKDRVSISSFSLIDMFPGGDWKTRRVIRNFTFK